MQELEVCPFCGGEAALLPHPSSVGKFFVLCADEYGTCKVKPCTELLEKEEAITTWNMWPQVASISVKNKDERVNDIDLRAMLEDEVDYKGHAKESIDKALDYIKNSNRLMELLDLVVGEAISAVADKEVSI